MVAFSELHFPETNKCGIWIVKMILERDQALPPFLIINEEGEADVFVAGEIIPVADLSASQIKCSVF